MRVTMNLYNNIMMKRDNTLDDKYYKINKINSIYT